MIARFAIRSRVVNSRQRYFITRLGVTVRRGG
jgi:hypothetical protein